MICICDKRTPQAVLSSLESRGFDVIQLPTDPSLPEPVSGHIDLLIFIFDGHLLTRRQYYRIAKAEIDHLIDQSGCKLVLSEKEAGEKYPNDCGLCAVAAGNNLIYCEAAADPSLLNLAVSKGLSLLKVPQGYAKCSCANLADGSIITADRGIAKVTQESGIETLLITPGHVDLPGYDYGFIGGASGLCGNILYFAGRIEDHPDYDRIHKFANQHKTEIVSLGDGLLYDIGSILFI